MTRFIIEFAKWLRLNTTIKNIKATKNTHFALFLLKENLAYNSKTSKPTLLTKLISHR